MANPAAPQEGSANTRRLLYVVDPANPGTAYMFAGEGEIDMGAGTPAAFLYALPPPVTAATQTAVASSASSVSLLAANAARKGVTIYNASTQILYVHLAAGAATVANCSFPMAAGAYIEIPFRYTGEIRGIWASANGFANVTEFV